MSQAEHLARLVTMTLRLRENRLTRKVSVTQAYSSESLRSIERVRRICA
jgi:hypothetical protein